MVVTPELVAVVHTPHMLIVQVNGGWTLDWCTTTIFALPHHLCILDGISVGCCHYNWAFVNTLGLCRPTMDECVTLQHTATYADQ